MHYEMRVLHLHLTSDRNLRIGSFLASCFARAPIAYVCRTVVSGFLLCRCSMYLCPEAGENVTALG